MSDQKEEIKEVQNKPTTEASEKKEAQIDDLDAALDEGDDDPLNITQDERSQQGEDDIDPNMKQEYEQFMKEMGEDGGKGMQFMNQMLGQMFQGMNLNVPGEGQQPGNAQNQQGNDFQGGQMPDFNAFQNQFGDMFKNFEDNPEYDALANHLLQEFMDKDILEEPLVDSQKKYKEYLEQNKDKLTAEDKERYQKQQKCIDEILEIVQKEPNNKDKMIAKFEEMQEYGQPPEPLINAFGGESPFAAFTQPQPQQQQQQQPGFQGMPNMMGGDPQDCNIF
ncbi:Pex19 family protein (macronuclear) [Tetrahymena thermophila SB210]|uniref:Pex19 family protein n=1 Tax=Tetrahymena thermophila (strain SB210) TaxID=312017 RepID=Q23AR4_TETTS|nr:Pex19 family protein [Tetrahymena thermophila SB210]EAR93628.2 Pex19 family protein [Tetrahymena thermophila SB210]|eukprot:XP_001013873.2 Pex19 family protein [Tetrahymena thermophila SB210]